LVDTLDDIKPQRKRPKTKKNNSIIMLLWVWTKNFCASVPLLQLDNTVDREIFVDDLFRWKLNTVKYFVRVN
jgi:hypothetical protein